MLLLIAIRWLLRYCHAFFMMPPLMLLPLTLRHVLLFDDADSHKAYQHDYCWFHASVDIRHFRSLFSAMPLLPLLP